MAHKTTIWAFDLGKGSIGEAVRAIYQNEKTGERVAGLILKTLFGTGVTAWRLVTQFALSNFVLIPGKN